MDNIHVNYDHCVDQLKSRYPQLGDKAGEVVSRLTDTLGRHTPEDWRFTESPSSRFFVLDEETGARFLGFTFRESPGCRSVLNDLQKHCARNEVKKILDNETSYVNTYISEVSNPDLPIFHDIRTVYGKGIKSTIAEEKDIFEGTRSNLLHLLPLMSHKIAARPNALVTPEGCLFVRQLRPWIGLAKADKEYYLFQPLLKESGVDKSRGMLISATENGDFRRVPCDMPHATAPPPDPVAPLFSQLKQGDATLQKYRSESYWKIPTCLDSRLIDLDFKERCPEKNLDEPLRPEERTELYFLRRIVERAKSEKGYAKSTK